MYLRDPWIVCFYFKIFTATIQEQRKQKHFQAFISCLIDAIAKMTVPKVPFCIRSCHHHLSCFQDLDTLGLGPQHVATVDSTQENPMLWHFIIFFIIFFIPSVNGSWCRVCSSVTTLSSKYIPSHLTHTSACTCILPCPQPHMQTRTECNAACIS